MRPIRSIRQYAIRCPSYGVRCNAEARAAPRVAARGQLGHPSAHSTRSRKYTRTLTHTHTHTSTDALTLTQARAARVVAAHGQLATASCASGFSAEAAFPTSDAVLSAKAHLKQRYVERQHLLAQGIDLGVQGAAVGRRAITAVFGPALRL
jgi:hypothetical protein